MAAVISSLLEHVVLPSPPNILEIGCGSGTMLSALARLYPAAHIDGLDLHPVALAYARSLQPSAPGLIQADLHHIPCEDAAYDLVLALDAFDQSAVKIAQGLAEAQRVLRRNGWLALRVSAYRWLHGAHDVAFNTGRRYDRSTLEATVRNAGFALRRTTYANTLLSPPVIALRLLERRRGAGSNDGLYLSPLANQVVQRALQAEAAWLRYADLPFGLSLIVLAQKKALP